MCTKGFGEMFVTFRFQADQSIVRPEGVFLVPIKLNVSAKVRMGGIPQVCQLLKRTDTLAEGACLIYAHSVSFGLN